MLDLFWGFAHVASVNNYVRPEFVGVLALKGARHPLVASSVYFSSRDELELTWLASWVWFNSILDRYAGPVVPNDVYANDTSAFQIIQGPK